MEINDAGGSCCRSVLLAALINLFLVEGGGRGDHAKERGDPFAERLPERGPAGEGGSKADPNAAGHPEAQRAESQGEGAQQKGEEQTTTQTHSSRAPMRAMTTPLCSGSGFANGAAVQGSRDQRNEIQTAQFRQKEDCCSAASAQVSYHGYRHECTSFKSCPTRTVAASRGGVGTPSQYRRDTFEQASKLPHSGIGPCA